VSPLGPPDVALPDAPLVAERLAALRARVAATGVDPAEVAVVAVTKGFPPEVVLAATAAGLAELGENYAQQLVAKVDWLAARPDPPTVRWQFIGQLQRRKVRQLAPHVSRWQSVDRPELVDELARRAPGARLLVQVNTTDEPQKAGCRPAGAAALVARARDAGLEVEGLMAVGPTGPEADPAPAFAALRHLVDELGLRQCSMGMTDDLETAVREGSTMIRVGRALFGPRPAGGRVGN
jgi:PLP dependent protein